MGLVPVEKTFPRGAVEVDQPFRDKSQSRINRRSQNANVSLFGKKPMLHEPNQTTSKTAKRDGFKKDKAPYFRMKRYAGHLTHKTISEGMLILGTVYRIEDLKLFVSLPGRVTGIVPLTNISEEYSSAVRDSMLTVSGNVYKLSDMFKIGQHVATRVTNKEFRDHCYHVTLTLAPEVVFADFGHKDVLRGSVFAASVKSIEEKGYIMNLGVKSTRAFLNKEKSKALEAAWNDGNSLGIGQIVRCLVVKSTTSDNFTTVELTADPLTVAKASADITGATLETLVPGMLFSLTVSRIFPTGIQVRLSDNFIGYVHQDHFAKPFKLPENHVVDSIVHGRVLYILDSGAVHFTLKNGILDASPPKSPFQVVELGQTVESATVMSVSESGLVVQLAVENETFKAFVPIERSKRKPADDEFDISREQQMLLDYPLGSKVKCRVLDYNHLEQYYFCTMDEALQSEKIIHVDQLKVGMVVPCFVKVVNPSGIVLKMGKKSTVTGLVPKIHVSDVPLTHHEKKFSVGQSCNARVLSKDQSKLLLTMKPALVKSSAEILTDVGEAVVGSRYLGTVVMVKSTGVLVVFYNNVTGWIPLRLLNVRWQEDPADRFYVGRVVNCKIDSIDNGDKRLLLSLKPDAIETEADRDETVEDEVEEMEDIPLPTPAKKKRNKKKKSQVTLEETLAKYKEQNKSLAVAKKSKKRNLVAPPGSLATAKKGNQKVTIEAKKRKLSTNDTRAKKVKKYC